MKLEQLRQKQLDFDHTFDPQRTESIRNRLKLFNQQFPIRQIKDLAMDDYVYGRIKIDHKKTFCYWMEKELSDFGKIAGSPCSQYGVWYGTQRKDKAIKYRHTKIYGYDFESSFTGVKDEIHRLYQWGQQGDLAAIAKSKMGNKYKGKILATYFPDQYLSIYADDYLRDILRYFNLDDHTTQYQAPIYLQQLLLEWKKKDEVMTKWDLPKFAMFINRELYQFYPDKKRKKADNEENLYPEFPELKDVNFIVNAHEIDENHQETPRKPAQAHHKKKPDYGKKTVRDMAIGTRGEQLVKEYEIRKLIAQPDLMKKVNWVSEKTDGKGYDIESFELDGTAMQIEVKATVKSFKGTANFYLTEFERLISQNLPNYYVYYISNVLSDTPEIWVIKAPFQLNQKGIQLQPILYAVEIQSKS